MSEDYFGLIDDGSKIRNKGERKKNKEELEVRS